MLRNVFLTNAEFPRSFDGFSFLTQSERDLLARLYHHPFDLFATFVDIAQLDTVSELSCATQEFARVLDEHGFPRHRALILAVQCLYKLDMCGFCVCDITQMENLLD